MHARRLVASVAAAFGANVSADRFGPGDWIALALGIVMFAIVVGFMILSAYEVITTRRTRREHDHPTDDPPSSPDPGPGSNAAP